MLLSHLGSNTFNLFSSKEIYFLYIFKSIKYSGNTVFKDAPHSCKNLINWQYCSLICKALFPKSASKTAILPGGSFPIKFLINIYITLPLSLTISSGNNLNDVVCKNCSSKCTFFIYFLIYLQFISINC